MAGNERNEHSVLISIDDLTAGSPNQGAEGGGATRDESGLLDLQALENAGLVGRTGGDVDSPTSAPAFEPSSTLRVSAPRQGPGVGLIVAVALGTIVVLGGGVVLGIKLFGQPDPAAAAQAGLAAGQVPPSATAPSGPASGAPSAPAVGASAVAVASAPESAPDSLAAAPASATGSEAGDEKGEEAGKPAAAKAPSRPTGPRPATKRNSAVASAAPATPASAAPVALANNTPKATREVDDMLGALDGNKTGGGGKPVPMPVDPTLPTSLDRQQIMSVVTRNAAGVRQCTKEVGEGSGTAMVEIVINASGSVTSADVVSGDLKGTPLGDCVSRKVKVFRFAQFNGDPMRIKMPFRL